MEVQGNAPTPNPNHPIQAPKIIKASVNAETKAEEVPQPVDETETDPVIDQGKEEVDTAETTEEEGQHDEGEVAEEQEEEPTIRYVVDGKPMTANLDEAKQALSSVKHLSKLRNEIVENNRKASEFVKEAVTQRQTLVQRAD